MLPVGRIYGAGEPGEEGIDQTTQKPTQVKKINKQCSEGGEILMPYFILDKVR